MSQPKKVLADGEILPEYDFRGAVRGKYYERYRQGTNVVILDPDVAAAFPNAEAVNRALRLLLTLARTEASPAKRPARKKQRTHPVPQRAASPRRR